MARVLRWIGISLALAVGLLSCGQSGGTGETGSDDEGSAALPSPRTFTLRATNTSSDLQALASDGNVIVAAGTSMLLHSEDGVNWQQPIPTIAAYNVAFGNGRFVATGFRGNAFVSNDGINWMGTTINADGASDVWIYGLSFGFGRFYATSPELEPGTYLTTNDGVSWSLATAQPSSIATAWSSMAFTSAASALLIMSSGQTSPSTGNFVTFDGSTWEPLPQWFSVIHDVVFDGRIYCAGSSMFPSAVSEDGRIWTTTEGGLPTYGVAYQEGVFFGVSVEGNVFASYDCLEWGPGADPPLPAFFVEPSLNTSTPLNLAAIRVHKNRLVIAGRNGSIFTSP